MFRKPRCASFAVSNARLFGPDAATPDADALQDWALERYTVTDEDPEGILEHPFAIEASDLGVRLFLEQQDRIPQRLT